MKKFLKNLEGKVLDLIESFEKTYCYIDEDDIEWDIMEPERLSPDDQKLMRRAAEIFLVGSAVGAGALGVYAKDFPIRTTFYSISGVMVATYIFSKIYSKYKMKEQCKDCRHELRNVEKLYEKSGAKYGQSIGPCTLFKPNQMMLNCEQHKKYKE